MPLSKLDIGESYSRNTSFRMGKHRSFDNFYYFCSRIIALIIKTKDITQWN